MARDPKIEKAKALWDKSGGTITNKEIAQRLGIENERKVGAWKSRYDWEGKKVGDVVQQKKKRCTTKKKRVVQQSTTVDVGVDQAMLASVEANEELNDERGLFCYFVAAGHSDVKAYMNAYKCSYENAKRHAYILRKNEEVNAEIARLKEIVVTCGDVPTASEVLERYAKLFYAKPSEFIDYGTEEEKDGDVAIKRNYLRFRDPATIDEEIISSVTLGKDGAKVEIDKNKALDFLTKWHELNPMDRHKKEYDNARLEIEREKAGANESPLEGIEVGVTYDKTDSPSE